MIPRRVRQPIERLVELDRAYEQRWIKDLLAVHRRNIQRFASNLEQVEALISEAIEQGVKPNPYWLMRQQRWEQMLADYERGVEGMATRANEWAANRTTGPEQMMQAAQESIRAAAADNPALALTANAAFDRLDVPAIAAAIANDQSERMAALTAKLAPDAAKRMREELIYGMSSGQSFAKTARQLRKVADLPAGQAVVITRTEGITTMRRSLKATYDRSPVVKGWIWWTASDRRVCFLCLARHGERCTGEMNSHPNCRCTMLPDLEDRGVDSEWDRVAGENGEDRLRAMSEAEQRRLLGDARWNAWKRGDLSLRDMVEEYQHGPYAGMRAKSLTELDLDSNLRLMDLGESPADEIKDGLGISDEIQDVHDSLQLTEYGPFNERPKGLILHGSPLEKFGPKGQVGTYNVKAQTIEIWPGSPFPRQTYIHEYSHWLDHRLGGAEKLKVIKSKTGLPSKAYRDSNLYYLRNSLEEELKRSSVYKSLYRMWAESENVRATNQALYLMRTDEMIARALQKYLSEEVGGADAKEFAEMVAQRAGMENPANKFWDFPPEDWEKIKPRIRSYLEAMKYWPLRGADRF